MAENDHIARAARLNSILASPNARLVLSEYLESRLQVKQTEFMRLNREQFDVQKGRCIELTDILNELKEGRVK